ncbi:polymeric immunoglobulin receptor isoform X2 [Esox lucius]|uniref:polymeric immunoglobulin receptor isoform X2 n=1 Tax=Esox lucius TaxID=8010 RepID=UPI00147710B4|nr:polymeric immunoglobulin receptor isoform X2 [Esox lucius]
MAYYLSFLILIILSRGSGVQAAASSVSTVSKLSVEKGKSITVPCRYDQRYRQYFKYWCRGDYWNSCSTLAHTNQPKISGTVLISDDNTQTIFSVTMLDLKPEDSGYYWCAVETTGQDLRSYLHLSVTSGSPGLYVEQQLVTGVEGGSVTVHCYYSNIVAKRWLWCKMGIYYAPILGRYSGMLDGTYVTSHQTIDQNKRHILTVTLNRLKMRDTGWYWCSNGDLQMPVHVTVNQPTTTQRTTPESTTTSTSTSTTVIPTVNHVTKTQTATFISEYLDVQTGGSITIPCHYDQKYIRYVKYWCKGSWDFCKYAARTDKTMGTKTSISDDLIRRVFTVTMTVLTPADSDYYWCAVEINKGPDIRIQRFYLSVTETQSPDNPQTSSTSTSGPVVNTSHRTDSSSGLVEDNATQEVEGRKQKKYHQWLDDLKILLIPLVMLLVLIAGVLVAWKMWRKHGNKKANDQPTNTACDPFPGDDASNVTYSTIALKRKTQQDLQTKAEPEDNVVYSSVAHHLTRKATEPDDNVLYSSIVL